MLDNFYIYSDSSMRCIRRTTRGCRPYRSSHAGCRFGRCGNRQCIALRLGCCGRLGLRVRSCLGRCRYRCSCLCRCTPAIGGCRPRRIRFPLRCPSRLNHAGMTFLKLLCLSDGLAGVLCLNPTYGYYMIQFYLASRLY